MGWQCCKMDVMAEDTTPARVEWNYSVALLLLLCAMLLQMTVLPCLCYRGTVNMYIAGAVDAMVILRLMIARMCRERGKGWIFYAILPFVIVPAVLVIEHIWVP